MTEQDAAALGVAILALIAVIAIAQAVHAIVATIDGIRYEMTKRRWAREAASREVE